MRVNLIAQLPFIATGALSLALIAGNQAVSQEMTSAAVVDAHEQARRLLQGPAIPTTRSATAPAVTEIGHSTMPDAQEQARNLLSHAVTGAQALPELEGAAQNLHPKRVDAQTLAAQLLLKPNSY